jgi:hypothetical protein
MFFFSDNYLSKEAIFIYCLFGIGFSSLLLPKKFPKKITVLLFVMGCTIDTLFDYSIGGHKLDLYDTFHSPRYTLMDLITYISFSPFPYIFIYIYEHFRIKRIKVVFYIMGWTVFSIGVEGLAVYLGVFTYKFGYHLYYSIPIYLYTQSLTVALYHWMRSPGKV